MKKDPDSFLADQKIRLRKTPAIFHHEIKVSEESFRGFQGKRRINRTLNPSRDERISAGEKLCVDWPSADNAESSGSLQWLWCASAGRIKLQKAAFAVGNAHIAIWRYALNSTERFRASFEFSYGGEFFLFIRNTRRKTKEDMKEKENKKRKRKTYSLCRIFYERVKKYERKMYCFKREWKIRDMNVHIMTKYEQGGESAFKYCTSVIQPILALILKIKEKERTVGIKFGWSMARERLLKLL